MMIYNTKFGQTLAQICDEIHLENPDYLRDFHNKNCPLTESFEGDAFKGTRVFIPTTQSGQLLDENPTLKTSPFSNS